MKTFTKEVKFFTFENMEDIKSDLFKKCYEKNMDINTGLDFWYEDIKEDFKTILEYIGFYDIECYFSGFYSQGDGACFVGKYSYKKGALKKIKEYAPKSEELHEIAGNIQDILKSTRYAYRAEILHNSRYCHEKTMYLNDSTNEKADRDFLRECQNLARWYYKQLTRGYEYNQSEKAVMDAFIANEYEFDEFGNIA